MRGSPGLLFASLLGAVLLVSTGCSSNPTTPGTHGPNTSPAASSDKKPDSPKDGATSGRPPFKLATD